MPKSKHKRKGKGKGTGAGPSGNSDYGRTDRWLNWAAAPPAPEIAARLNKHCPPAGYPLIRGTGWAGA